MAHFAKDCRAKMNEILPELEEKLGEVRFSRKCEGYGCWEWH
jgi:hypothetical protein